jgi:hypothetical protein
VNSITRYATRPKGTDFDFCSYAAAAFGEDFDCESYETNCTSFTVNEFGNQSCYERIDHGECEAYSDYCSSLPMCTSGVGGCHPDNLCYFQYISLLFFLLFNHLFLFSFRLGEKSRIV